MAVAPPCSNQMCSSMLVRAKIALVALSVFFQNTFILQSLDGFRVLRVTCFYDAEGDTFFSMIGFSIKFLILAIYN
ncbi:hypothetical protein RHGRI_036248 [Rhododendron griersonianum]|uniref:Uncharacterized protein n=1 Tax=Rhododendron griersonianum TaxID=479676 RepID=A0AAV6HN31_9ERIC|nr:hypothetical protein RHGRI_036248 [Rhododendron griersonianum]